MRKYFTWKGLRKHIHSVCASCVTCIKSKANTTLSVRLSAPPVPLAPFHTLHIDQVAGLPPINGLAAAWLVLDRFTGFIFVIPCPAGGTARDAAALLWDRVFAVTGLPSKLVLDEQKAFTASFFAEVNRRLGVSS